MSKYSVLPLFKIGVGPSSSHTLGPMICAYNFINKLDELKKVKKIEINLYGSLALTGKGHATDTACMLGLMGNLPKYIDPKQAKSDLKKLYKTNSILLNKQQEISFTPKEHINFHMDTFLPQHPNAMIFKAYDLNENLILKDKWFSIGGGQITQKITQEDRIGNQPKKNLSKDLRKFKFNTADELLDICKKNNLSFSDLGYANEIALGKTKEEIDLWFIKVAQVMFDSIDRGCSQDGLLPGELGLKRRAKKINEKLINSKGDPLEVMDWVSLFALAVSEENGAGGKVVTAPTNGSAGVIPAVLAYFRKFIKGANKKLENEFLMTCSVIGWLYTHNASISAAEVGCQGEIGVASSMAAGALAQVQGATIMQVENAAEMAMEHHLGMTCDPIAGLVQVPCIERNTMGAIKAINASRLALMGDGTHRVSLDSVIKTMYETGKDMQSKYRETAKGGLAVNVAIC